jgi:uncharacterized protein (DUF3820 family)
MQTATALTDNSPMPFGKHRGQALINVPASYLIWLYDAQTKRMAAGEVLSLADRTLRTYINNNLDALRVETAKAKR